MKRKYKKLIALLLSVSLFLPILAMASGPTQLPDKTPLPSKDRGTPENANIVTLGQSDLEKMEPLDSSTILALGQSEAMLGASEKNSAQAMPIILNSRRVFSYTIGGTTTPLRADVTITADNMLGRGLSLPDFSIGAQRSDYYDDVFWIANPQELRLQLKSGSGFVSGGETVMIQRMDDDGNWSTSRGPQYESSYWSEDTTNRTITVKMGAFEEKIKKEPGIYRIVIEGTDKHYNVVRAAFLMNPEGLIPTIKFPGATGKNNQDPSGIEIHVTHHIKNHPNPIQKYWTVTGNGKTWQGNSQEELTRVFSTLKAGSYNITLQGETASQYGNYTIKNQTTGSFTLTKDMVVHPQEVVLDKDYILLKAGTGEEITATVHPSNASNTEVLWELQGDRLDFATLELSTTLSEETNKISSLIQNDGVLKINAYSPALPDTPATCVVEVDGTKPTLEIFVDEFEDNSAPLTLRAVDPIVNQVSSGIKGSYYNVSSTVLSIDDFDASNPLKNGWTLYQEGATIPSPLENTTRVYAVTMDNVGHVSEMIVSEPLINVGDISVTIAASHIWNPHGSPVFTTRLTGISGAAAGKVYLQTVVLSGTNSASDLADDTSSRHSDSKTLEFLDLPQGEYTLEVIAPLRYQITADADTIRSVSTNSSHLFEFECTNLTYMSDTQTEKITFQVTE